MLGGRCGLDAASRSNYGRGVVHRLPPGRSYAPQKMNRVLVVAAILAVPEAHFPKLLRVANGKTDSIRANQHVPR